MKICAILLIAIVLCMATLIRADVKYFKEPTNNQMFAAGTSTRFTVAQLPSFDGKSIYANLYHDGQAPSGNDKSDSKKNPNFVMTIQSWSAGSVGDDQKNDFTFTWQIPSNLRPGAYYAQIDINNEADDNDFCRSLSFVISPATHSYGGGSGVGVGGGGGGGSGQFVGYGRPAGGANTYNTHPAGSVGSGMKTSTGGGSNSNSYNAGQRYNSGARYNEGHGNTFNAIHLRRRALRRA